MKFSSLCPKKKEKKTKKNISQQSSYVLLIRSQSQYLIVNMQMNQLKNMLMICDFTKHQQKHTHQQQQQKQQHEHWERNGDVTETNKQTQPLKKWNETKKCAKIYIACKRCIVHFRDILLL